MTQLAINGGQKAVTISSPHYVWPRITDSVRTAVMDQLEETVSIYNRSGIIKAFEEQFAAYHGKKYALLSNSGTNAIFSMFEGLNFQQGDEVIFPSYTFFASASPIIYTGATPIFCDCDSSGNISVAELRKLISPRTKAVVVTHMWGLPCDMVEIASLCKNMGVMLLEDCSHAHGAMVGNQKTGTFGTAAAWSLQGQKIITGGEGGIMITDDRALYERATLQGHYNKRSQQEVERENPLFMYAMTGLGLKFRAHPLAIAMAAEQFSHLDQWIQQKHAYALKLINAFQEYDFLKMPQFVGKQPSWYAFVMQYEESMSKGVSIEQFTNAALAEGLKELDRPGSTSPIHNLPLFTHPHLAMPRLYNAPIEQPESFPEAEKFYQMALKLPVWAFADEAGIVDAYIDGMRKVCDAVVNNPDQFKKHN